MPNEIEPVFRQLIDRVSSIGEVLSVGRSGGRRLPQSPADGDIDVFIYCGEIPSNEKRLAVLNAPGGSLDSHTFAAIPGGGHWGRGDLAVVSGVETWLMYFTLEEASAEVDAVLAGALPDRADKYYYPVGRCAMLAGMEILCDKTGFLSALKARLSVYPEELAQKLAAYHLDALEDDEDLQRAVARKDALFYHFALDLALDHFLQALFALNCVWFPSRKRSLEHIAKFERKPQNCGERLLEALRLGGEPEGLARSYEMFMELVKALNS